MNPPTVLRPETPGRSRRRFGLGLGVVALLVAGAVAMTFLVGLSSGPGTVARITYDNPTVYGLGVEVSSEAESGWVFAGFVAPRSTGVAEDVIDQGDVWLFRFDSQGEIGGEVRLTRAELEAANWQVTVPAHVGARLAELGAPPTP
jgi:hypothetical protein